MLLISTADLTLGEDEEGDCDSEENWGTEDEEDDWDEVEARLAGECRPRGS